MENVVITPVILTKNEEENIPRCLASLPWPGVIVVDSGSTDATVEVARRNGASVFCHQQSGIFEFATQRNWAIASCNIGSQWILFLDADEELTSQTVQAIEKASARGEEYDAFEMTPRFLFWGRWLQRTQGYPNWHPRMVKNIEAPFEGGVWEHFRSGLRVGKIAEPYNHYAFSKGISEWLARHNRYSTWDAEKANAYLQSGDSRSLGSSRKVRLRRLAARFWPIRPVARFIYMYLFRMGFTEGIPGFVYCALFMFYEFLIAIKINEQRRIKRGLPL